MNALKNKMIVAALALFMILGNSLRAQSVEQTYEELKVILNDYMVLCSQAQGTCQQVETFARNGNMNQFMNSTASLSRSVSEMALFNTEVARRPVPNRLINAGLQALSAAITEDIQTWAAAQRATVEATGDIAARLRESLDNHRGQAHEWRVAICCRAE